MLIIRRHEGEAIILTIGDEKVRICVESIGTKKVKLSIDKPVGVHVRREEAPEHPLVRLGPGGDFVRDIYAARDEFRAATGELRRKLDVLDERIADAKAELGEKP